MNTIGERLKELRLNKNMSQLDVAKKLGISRGQISKIESDTSNNITVSTLVSYMNFFSVSADYIVSGKHTTNYFTEDEKILVLAFRKLSEKEQCKILNFIEISTLPDKSPSISSISILEDSPSEYSVTKKYSVPALGKVAAGAPIEAIENVLTFIETDQPNVQFALYAKGDSMEPVILDGDIILVQKTLTLENGEIGVFKINDDVTCKIYRSYRDRIELHSINKNYSPLVYLKNSLNTFQIIGKVILTAEQKVNFAK